MIFQGFITYKPPLYKGEVGYIAIIIVCCYTIKLMIVDCGHDIISSCDLSLLAIAINFKNNLYTVIFGSSQLHLKLLQIVE